MFKKNATKLMILAAVAVTTFTSCQKEDVLTPDEQPAANENSTVIYIRAVDKDSSAVESQQVVLR